MKRADPAPERFGGFSCAPVLPGVGEYNTRKRNKPARPRAGFLHPTNAGRSNKAKGQIQSYLDRVRRTEEDGLRGNRGLPQDAQVAKMLRGIQVILGMSDKWNSYRSIYDVMIAVK